MSEYNGWKNYETWCVKLWMDNEYSEYCSWKEHACAVWDAAEERSCFTKSETARYDLADQLEQIIAEDNIPEDMTSGLYADLLGAALSEVDWSEIANELLEECEGYEDKKDAQCHTH